jgi:hypothetical protein
MASFEVIIFRILDSGIIQDTGEGKSFARRGANGERSKSKIPLLASSAKERDLEVDENNG